MGLMNKIFGNTRKPEGWMGKLMAKGMNVGGHAAMAKWALESLPVKADAEILDVGCGGGGNIGRLLEKCPQGHVTGIDYSKVSVEQSSKYNRKAIDNGRCRVLEGNVQALPFKDASFDCVTAFETVYFWPTIEDSFRQVLRVLRPGGSFMIVNETDGEDPAGLKWDAIVGGMHTYNRTELETHLTNAGFTDIAVTHDEKTHNLKVVSTKPSATE